MEVEERYEVIVPSLNGYAYIHDFKTDNVLNTYDSCDLINQQDKQIKELQKKLSNVYDKTNESLRFARDSLQKLNKENQKLKQQLEDTEYVKCLNECLNTILNRYGEKNEN